MRVSLRAKQHPENAVGVVVSTGSSATSSTGFDASLSDASTTGWIGGKRASRPMMSTITVVAHAGAKCALKAYGRDADTIRLRRDREC